LQGTLPSRSLFASAIGLALRCSLIAALCPGALPAQNPSGALRGTIQDAGGARIPAASVAVYSPANAQTRKVTCDSHGEFRVDGLAAGTWRVTVSARGFAQADADVQVAVSEVRDVVVTMKPAAVAESVSVKAQGST